MTKRCGDVLITVEIYETSARRGTGGVSPKIAPKKCEMRSPKKYLLILQQ